MMISMERSASAPGSPKGAALSRSLQKRSREGPPEPQKPFPARLRNTRTCSIMHNTITEPLSAYKSLEPLRPCWPHCHRRSHIKDGVRVLDNDTVVVTTHDTLSRTKRGLARSSSGTVTYSASHLLKLELDVREVAQVLVGDVPGGGHAWTPKRVEHIFRERTGRAGCWAHYGLSFMALLSLFPRTFEIFGNGQYVRLRTCAKGCPALQDTAEEAFVRLARARAGQEQREIEEEQLGAPPNSSPIGRRGGGMSTSAMSLPDLSTNRFKVVYLRNDEKEGPSAYEDQVPSQDLLAKEQASAVEFSYSGKSQKFGGSMRGSRRGSSTSFFGTGSGKRPVRHTS